MNDIVYEKYLKAGKIAAEIRNYGLEIIKSGSRFLDVAEILESKIKKYNLGIAFPVNISINEIAAHYSPRHDDSLIFKKGDVVKLDIGTHVDGYIADTAVTIEIGSNQYIDLITASNDALENAINFIKSGVNTKEIGKIIEGSITSFGYKPIANLTGHSLRKYELHSGVSIPNVANSNDSYILQEGDVLAIEPFSTNGAGYVVAGRGSNIYLCEKSLRSKMIRDQRSKRIYNKILGSFNTLPFAQRWCHNLFSDDIDHVLKKLSFLGLAKHYPQLIEKKGGMVTQKEHTVIVKEDGCEVIT